MQKGRSRRGGKPGPASLWFYLDSQVQCAAVSIHQQESGLFRAADGLLEIGGIRYRFAIDLLNDVAAAAGRHPRPRWTDRRWLPPRLACWPEGPDRASFAHPDYPPKRPKARCSCVPRWAFTDAVVVGNSPNCTVDVALARRCGRRAGSRWRPAASWKWSCAGHCCQPPVCHSHPG